MVESPPQPPEVVTIALGSFDAPAGGLSFVSGSASADGAVVALSVRGGDEPTVLVIRRDQAASSVASPVRGRLVPSTTPLLVTSDDGDAIEVEDLVGGRRYAVPYDGVANGPRMPWYRDTFWAVAGDGAAPMLVRAFTTGDLSATSIAAYRPDQLAPAWQVAITPGAVPGVIADAAVSRDGATLAVQFTDGRGRARLVAYDTATGHERWTQATGATYEYFGALVLGPDDTVVSILADGTRCEVCEQIEVRQFSDGSLRHKVSLDGAHILVRLGARHVATYLGATSTELWFRFANGPQPRDAMTVEHYSYEAFDLQTGAGRQAGPEWAPAFETAAVTALAIRDGVVVARSRGAQSLELARFTHAP